MDSDRQALWRTCVQVVSSIGLVAGVVFVTLSETIWIEFFPDIADDVRVRCVFVAALVAAACSAGYWASLRRMKPDADD